MNRAFLLLSVLALANLAAVPNRPPVDREAMAEATGAVAVEGYASARAYHHYLEARLAEHRGDLRRAVEEMQLAAVFDPGSAEVRLALGWLYAATDALERAEVEAKRTLALAPGEAGAHLLLGKLHAARHRRGPAEKSLGAAIAAAPDDPEAYLALIQLYADLGAERSAWKVATRLARVAPGEAEGYRILARAALDRNDSPAALRALVEAIRRDPWDFESRLQAGALYERRGHGERALEAYREILERNPGHEEALLGVARVALALGDDATAREYVQRLVESAPDGPRARKRAAMAYAGARRYREALALLDEATRLAPGDPELAFHRGTVLEEERHFLRAAEAFRQVPAHAPELYALARARAAGCLSRAKHHGEALRLLGEALRELGEGRDGAPAGLGGAAPGPVPGARSGEPLPPGAGPEFPTGLEARAEIFFLVQEVHRRAGKPVEGLRILEAAAARDRSPELLLALARSLEDAGRQGEAIARAREAFRMRPFDERFLFGLAATLERNGALEEAVELVQGALDRDPDHALALNFLGYVWADRGIRLDEARALLERAVRLRPRDGPILDSLGWLLVRCGEAERAVAILERADALSPDDPVIVDHLAEAYARSGRPAQAIRLWSRALELLDGDPRPRVRERIEARLRQVLLPGDGEPGPRGELPGSARSSAPVAPRHFPAGPGSP